jgi:predicted nucleic acid-binding Zn ribbon protein
MLDENFAISFEEHLQAVIRDECREVTIEEHSRKRNWYTQFRGWYSYQMIRLAMRLMYQLTSRKKKIL